MTGHPESRPAAKSGSYHIGDRAVTRLGFGAMRLTGQPGNWGPPKDWNDACAVLRRAVELGVQLIDTAASYGPGICEDLVYDALHPYDPDVVIATKGGIVKSGPGVVRRDGTPEALREHCEGSLRRLHLEAVDLYQLHYVDEAIPIEDSVGALRDLQEAGKIRSIGLCNVGLGQVLRAATVAPIASIQNAFNLTDREHADVLGYCESARIPFLAYRPIGGGALASSLGAVPRVAEALGATEAQVALAWLLATSPVLMPIPGTSSISHLETNVGAAFVTLGASTLSLLDRTA